jgi:hypothetical protein
LSCYFRRPWLSTAEGLKPRAVPSPTCRLAGERLFPGSGEELVYPRRNLVGNGCSPLEDIMSKPDEDPHEESDEETMEKLRRSELTFHRMVLTHPDKQEAVKLVEEHAGQNYDRAYAAEREVLTLESEELDAQANHAAERLRESERQERSTDSYATVPEVRKTGVSTKVPFNQWDPKDRLVGVLSGTGLSCLLPAASFNVFAAVMAQGIPVFLDHPWLAVGVSFLLPSGALAIHSIGDLLSSDRARHRYMLGTLSITAVVLVAWVKLFSDNFQIGAGAVDFESLVQQSVAAFTSTAFTFCQLFGELMAGASLFLILSHVLRRYTLDTTIQKPDMTRIMQENRMYRALCETAQKRSKGPRGRMAQIAAMRRCYITEQVALFLALRRRFDESNPLST